MTTGSLQREQRNEKGKGEGGRGICVLEEKGTEVESAGKRERDRGAVCSGFSY